ncbi:DUF4255 domain-containing protein [Streptomyces turgidiscabies]|uniref:Pvc16 N-terminal domain-containing protein n=1 Tax=Streptomyces turgidiscabies (strain Car8) TaxID=698760 RepID=L7FB25_STRT8|nr:MULTISPECIES: DUF4255 domain-containing protein [Streptomyces]ELP67860.1 hypothetical protein STRTUCAR8_02482 [Streptomyces turgidiscabies Car8]MDX3493683.1 DUF4255 domain-containing protein [Streptomyces turgidiscabies]GAQ71723.1 hypothetical protein T45_03467 [Streptomyces turgidiscabies]
MSNALAIAHVTQALAALIENNLGPEFDAAVTVETRKPPTEPSGEPTIHVFLYQVTPNTSQRNNDLPTRAADGTLVKRPAAALDLHYLISAYGEENELVGQRLIGMVVRTLHEIPILPKDVIEQAGEKPYLAGSDLLESAQRVRFTPTVMDVDETSKLWGMLYQTPYSLSVVYQAALVLIEGRESPVAAKPVQRSDVRVLPFGAPGAPAPGGRALPVNESAHGGSSDAEPEPGPESQPSSGPGKAAAKAPARKAVVKVPAKVTPARTRKAARPAKAAEPGSRGGAGKRATAAPDRADKPDNPDKPANTES